MAFFFIYSSNVSANPALFTEFLLLITILPHVLCHLNEVVRVGGGWLRVGVGGMACVWVWFGMSVKQ